MKLGVAVGEYRVPVAAAQQCVNLYPEVAENKSRGEVILRRTPGLTSFNNLAGTGRGLHVMAGILYAVVDQTLYKITSAGVSSSLGTVAGIYEVSIANNGVTMLIVQGGTCSYYNDYMVLTGRSIQTGYTSDGVTVTQIADIDFPTGDLGEAFHISTLSNPASWEGESGSAEGSPDPLVGHIVSHGELVLFGSDTVEFFVDTGDVDFPIERREGVRQDRGCLAERSIVLVDNTIYFLGDDRIVYRLEEYAIRRVSDHGVERALLAASLTEVQAAHALSYTYAGHHFYALTVGTETHVYDATASQQIDQPVWHRRHAGLNADTAWTGYWYAECYGKHFVMSRTGHIYEMSETEWQEAEGDALWQFVIGPFTGDSKEVSCLRVSLVCETGGIEDLTENPVVDLRVSTDGGRTWQYEGARSLGETGEYTQEVEWRRLGTAPGKTGFLFRFSGSGNYPIQVHDVDAEMSKAP